ncbi:MAG: DUF3791 domain-containing protein [Elusimicrobiota bacterium]|jgi:hypothetical protein|nr:DUF3791 domain-containing protein [Elusimicrobiota bacterium]
MTQEERDKNLMVVYAVEGYAKRHNMREKDTLELFRKYEITNAIRKYYETLHTQSLDENIYFAEDLLKGLQK